MTVSQSRRVSVLHVGTINKPIRAQNGYSPIETVIYNIDQGLTRLGHRSIVSCSGDSLVAGEHHQTVARSLGDYCRDSTREGDAQIDQHLESALARARRGDIDVVHIHQWFERVYSGRFNPPVPIVMTLHVPGQQSGMREFRESNPGVLAAMPSRILPVAISEYQRRQYTPYIRVEDVVHHGIDVAPFTDCPDELDHRYLFSIGRITEDKGQDTAIAVARRTNRQIIVAGCVQNKAEDRDFFQRLRPSLDLEVDLSATQVAADYYDRVMLPLIQSGKQVIYVGELTAEAAIMWYRHAAATLFPIRWGEPFGMVLIESMAAGTPVIAFGEGAVPEIIVDGKTGFIVKSVDAMVRAVDRIDSLDRENCRRHVQQHFSTDRMAAEYAAIYERVINRPALAEPVLASSSVRHKGVSRTLAPAQ